MAGLWTAEVGALKKLVLNQASDIKQQSSISRDLSVNFRIWAVSPDVNWWA